MTNNDRYTALIIGGGPAGASCALWLKMLGYSPVIVEQRPRLGGLQNESPFPNEWIVGLTGVIGSDIAARIHDHVHQLGIPAFTRSSVASLTRRGTGGWDAQISDQGERKTLQAEYIVLATGVEPRADGFVKSDSVLIGPGKAIADFDFRGKRVAILGGGDNAFENFFFVRDRGASKVRVFTRHVRARADFVRRMPADALSVQPYRADQSEMSVNGERFDVIIVLYGWVPVNPLAGHVALATDERGFVRTDDRRRSSDPDVYAIGEIAQKLHPCVVTSMSDGIVCAKDIQQRLEQGG